MNRRRFLALSVGAGATASLGPALFDGKLRRVERKSRALGAETSFVVYHENRATAERAIDAAFGALDSIEDVLSLYRPHSQICRLNREGLLKGAHPDLCHVLSSALEWSRLSGGAFDATIQPLWNAYATSKSPLSSEIEAARSVVGWKQVQIHGPEIRLGKGQQITLNGIAQGFAADRVREIFAAHGIQHALFNTGEFGALGNKADGSSWRIGIQHPRVRDAYAALTTLKDRFLSTSGDYETKFSDDFSTHHIFDPSTGLSPPALSSVTVLAPTGTEADALSTAIFVLGPGRGLELAARRSNVDVFMILKNGAVLSTPNFPKCA